MLDGAVSDSVEAASLSLNQDHIDIYSASWGPEDDGKTFDGPGPLAREAFYRGIKNGRGGKGNIFVWASGNGGSRQDSCSADGYTTSVYTLSISSATYDNHRPWYLEECPSSIATTYSSANINQPAIVSGHNQVTVDVPAGCTKMHTGTSCRSSISVRMSISSPHQIRYSKRGDLKLTLFSPAGTRSVLLPPRPQDFNSNGFHKWPFLSVQQWGEDPRGTWILMVESVTNNPTASGPKVCQASDGLFPLETVPDTTPSLAVLPSVSFTTSSFIQYPWSMGIGSTFKPVDLAGSPAAPPTTLPSLAQCVLA
uniref:P/Homo B domain-containing protein n=1 Tax=Heterorhabditis bacteriophora TaxID=37862 RepID=A0A1I7XHB5_HETBA